MSKRSGIHRRIYVALLCVTAASMTTSTFLGNLCWFLLLVNWVAEWQWSDKIRQIKENTLLHAFLTLFAVQLLWVMMGGDWLKSLFAVQKALPLLVLPLVVLTSPPLEQRERHLVIAAFLATIAVVSIIGIVRWITIDNLPYRAIVPYVSNIRFALNIVVAICLIVSLATRHWQNLIVVILSIAALIGMLLLIRSYTAIVVLAILSLLYAAHYIAHCKHTTTKTVLTVSYFIAILVAAGYIYHIGNNYYTPTPLEQAPLQTTTAAGHPYTHACDGMIENGGQVNNYICQAEIYTTWPMVSNTPLDTLTPNGYSVYPTLIRYLGSRGLTKDSVGIMALSPLDIKAVEDGYANHIFIDGTPLQKMVYSLLYEYEKYRVMQDLSNSSMGERLLLWDNAWHVFTEHPLLGVGTGNVYDACHARLDAIQSPMAQSDKNLHNQYLSFLVAFGLLGFLLIAIAFARSAWHNRHTMTLLQTAFAVIIIISCLDDDTLNVFSGIMLTTTPIAFLRNNKKQDIPQCTNTIH